MINRELKVEEQLDQLYDLYLDFYSRENKYENYKWSGVKGRIAYFGGDDYVNFISIKQFVDELSDGSYHKDYVELCNIYLEIFSDKQDLEDYTWYNKYDTLIKFGDYLFDFQDIKHDLDSRVEPGLIKEWYTKSQENLHQFINYDLYVTGLARFTEE